MSNEPKLNRLYVVVRSDLAPGLQMAQAVHAAFLYARTHADSFCEWMRDSQYLITVSVPSEAELKSLVTEAAKRGLLHVEWREPDLDDSTTAIALEPSAGSRRLCSNLPLAGRDLEVQEAHATPSIPKEQWRLQQVVREYRGKPRWVDYCDDAGFPVAFTTREEAEDFLEAKLASDYLLHAQRWMQYRQENIYRKELRDAREKALRKAGLWSGPLDDGVEPLVWVGANSVSRPVTVDVTRKSWRVVANPTPSSTSTGNGESR